MASADLIVPTFRVHVVPNEAASKTAGRPIFDQMEVVELRFAGDRQKVAVFPAHEQDPNATREAVEAGTVMPGEVVTYAQAYADQYRKFKAQEAQDVSGTPLSEAPFLQENKRRELKALNIHTVEALAALDGTPLKQLGMGGRELKTQAEAYLAKAAGSADVTEMAARIAQLEQQLKDRDGLIDNFASKQRKTHYQRSVEASLRAQERAEEAAEDEAQPDEPEGDAAEPESQDEPEGKPIEECSDAELKDFIKARTGRPVKGNPSRDTLMKQATELAKIEAEA